MPRFRGTGVTTKQMQDAPKDAVYVWCNDSLTYPKHLAHKIGRADLRITPYSSLFLNGGERFRGLCVEIVLDHAVEIYRANQEVYDFILHHNAILGEKRNATQR